MEELSIPAGFDKIWERVTARTENLPSAVPEISELENFLAKEGYILTAYAKILTVASSRERAQLGKMQASQRDIIRRLQLEYYVQSGDTLTMKQRKIEKSQGILSRLRQQFHDERDLAQQYKTAAEHRRSELANIYLEIADEKILRAMELKAILSRVM